MKVPGPDHPISITPNPRRVRVVFAGRVIADTVNALTLKEASLRPVQYIPPSDVDLGALVRTTRVTYCPFKGNAAYYSVHAAGRVAVNSVWTYESPYPTVSEIKRHLAFYYDKVDSIEEIDI